MSQFYCPVCGRKNCQTLGAGCRIQSISNRTKGTKEFTEGACFYCGMETLLVEEHVVPLARGGPGQECPWNIVRACSLCNSNKSDLLPSEWCPSHKLAMEIEARVPVIFPRMRYGFLLNDHEESLVRVRSLCANFSHSLKHEMNGLPSKDRSAAITTHRVVEKLRIRIESVIADSEARGHNAKAKEEFRHKVPEMFRSLLCARCGLTYEAREHLDGGHPFEDKSQVKFVDRS